MSFLCIVAPTAIAVDLELRPIEAASAILLEPTTGQVLYEMDPDRPRAPASIAKLMLELVVLEKVESGALRLDEPVKVSAWASKMGGSQVYLAEGEVFPLEELLKAIVIASANDACVAVAEHVAGSAEGFVDLMNLRAGDLGLKQTHYVNVHGLDDGPGEKNVTTARDIAMIARELVKHPHVLDWSSIQEAPFRNGEFILRNTNKLLGDFPGLDGLKTGFTSRADFCLCATAHRNGMRLISVVLGAASDRMRFRETARLLGAGFSQLRSHTVLAAGEQGPGTVPVSKGRETEVAAVAARDLSLILPERADPPTPVLVPTIGVEAPIAKGDTIGTFELPLDGGGRLTSPALAAQEVKRETIFQSIGRFFGGGR